MKNSAIVKNTTEPPGGKPPADMKNAGKKDRGAEARTEQRERQYRAFLSGWRAIWSEMRRVTWPSREEWVSATLVTIGLVVVVALWTSAVGQLAEWIFRTGQ
jgi:preprotein translocase SecE subunit